MRAKPVDGRHPGWSARDLADPKYLLSGVFSLEKLERYGERTIPINDFTKLPQQVFVTAVDIGPDDD